MTPKEQAEQEISISTDAFIEDLQDVLQLYHGRVIDTVEMIKRFDAARETFRKRRQDAVEVYVNATLRSS